MTDLAESVREVFDKIGINIDGLTGRLPESQISDIILEYLPHQMKTDYENLGFSLQGLSLENIARMVFAYFPDSIKSPCPSNGTQGHNLTQEQIAFILEDNSRRV